MRRMNRPARLASIAFGLLVMSGWSPSTGGAQADAGPQGAAPASAADRRRLHDEAIDKLVSPKSLEDYRRARDIFSRLSGRDDWRTRLADDAIRQVEGGERLDPARRGRVATMGRLHQQALEDVRSGRFREALDHEEQARAICEEVLGRDDSRYWNFLQGLATIHRRIGDYPEASKYYSESLRDLDRRGGRESMNHALVRGELAMMYFETGAWERASPLFSLAQEEWERWASDEFVRADAGGPIYGVLSRAYAVFLNNRAIFCRDTGDPDAARGLFEAAISMLDGLDQPRERAMVAANLADWHRSRGEFKDSIRLYEKCLEDVSRSGGNEFTELAVLCRLTEARIAGGDGVGRASSTLPKLESLLLGPPPGGNTRQLGECFLNLANAYDVLGDRAKAGRLFLEVLLERSREPSGSRDAVFFSSLVGLARVREADGDLAGARAFLGEAAAVALDWLETVPRTMGVRRRFDLRRSLRSVLDRYTAVALEGEAEAEELYGRILGWKGSIGAGFDVGGRVEGDPDLKGFVDELQAIRGRLSNLWHATTRSSVTPPLEDVARLASRKDELETLIAARSPARARDLDSRRIDVARLARALRPGTAFLDFFAYSHRGSADRRILAFVVRPGPNVAMIPLGLEGEMSEAINAWREAVGRGDDETRPGGMAVETVARMAWDPLLPHLGGVDELVVSPDGPLNLLPFGALPSRRTDGFLIEELPISYVASARSLVAADETDVPRGLLAVGGADYGTGAGDAKFGSLSGTLAEAARATEAFRRAYPGETPPADLWEGKGPTERRLKLAFAAPSPKRWSHILLSSHGVFSIPAWASGGKGATDLADPSRLGDAAGATELADSVRLGSLYFSGIALAGANRPDDEEDGVLTADEVHGLDISGAELVVLSGCGTALGVPTAGEGLLGLRSAFHAAGARDVMATLWKVEDGVTCDLIDQFYENLWIGRMTPRDALRHAQVRMLRTGSGASPHPYYWAGFVLSGPPDRSWAPLPEAFGPRTAPCDGPPQTDPARGRGYGRTVAALVAAALLAAAAGWAWGKSRGTGARGPRVR